MKKPLVTIAISFYNDGKYIGYAIQSVLNQTFKDFELILINDGGTDNSLDIAREFALKDKRVAVVDDGMNRGLDTRLNQSIRMAAGKYYARMDADDIMYCKRIEIQVDYLENHENVDVLGSSCMLIDQNNGIVGSHDMEGETSGFIHPTIMGRTEWFLSNPYAEWCKRAQDKELWCRTAGKSRFVNMKRPLFFYRESGPFSLDKYMNSQKSLLKIYSRYRNYGRGCVWGVMNSLETITAMAVYYIFAKVGKADYLVRRRNRKPLDAVLCLCADDLKDSIRLPECVQ